MILLLKICDQNVRKDMLLDEPASEEEIKNYPKRGSKKKSRYSLPENDLFKNLIL